MIDNRDNLPRRGGQRYPVRDLAAVNTAYLHYTAGANSASTLAVAQYQTGPTSHLDFPEIAYHYLVELDGVVHWCHDLDKRTWGSDGPGANERGVHICYPGDHEPTAAQQRGLRDAVRHAQGLLGRSLVVQGHKDSGSATQCPGPTWPAWKAAVLP